MTYLFMKKMNKPKLKFQRNILDNYDYSFIHKSLILGFIFSLILASFFSSILFIIYPSPNDDKPENKLTKDFAKNLRDAIKDSDVQASSSTVTVSDDFALEGGANIIP